MYLMTLVVLRFIVSHFISLGYTYTFIWLIYMNYLKSYGMHDIRYPNTLHIIRTHSLLIIYICLCYFSGFDSLALFSRRLQIVASKAMGHFENCYSFASHR